MNYDSRSFKARCEDRNKIVFYNLLQSVGIKSPLPRSVRLLELFLVDRSAETEEIPHMSQIGDPFSAEFEVLESELLNEIEVANRFYQRFGNFELR
jgi:hypothetical protein